MPLIILPNFLDAFQKSLEQFPGDLKKQIEKLDFLIAESEKSARRYLVKFLTHERANQLPVYLLNEHTQKEAKTEIIEKLKTKQAGLISDAGLPILADPGSEIVFLAHQNKIPVKAVLGPSAIIYALLVSGLPAQSFSFEGYLPREEMKLKTRVKALEKVSSQHQKTMFFIEAPYRNQKLMQVILEVLQEKTYLAVAVDLMSEREKIIVNTIKAWKEKKIDLHKKPAVFLIFAGKFSNNFKKKEFFKKP